MRRVLSPHHGPARLRHGSSHPRPGLAPNSRRSSCHLAGNRLRRSRRRCAVRLKPRARDRNVAAAVPGMATPGSYHAEVARAAQGAAFSRAGFPCDGHRPALPIRPCALHPGFSALPRGPTRGGAPLGLAFASLPLDQRGPSTARWRCRSPALWLRCLERRLAIGKPGAAGARPAATRGAIRTLDDAKTVAASAQECGVGRSLPQLRPQGRRMPGVRVAWGSSKRTCHPPASLAAWKAPNPIKTALSKMPRQRPSLQDSIGPRRRWWPRRRTPQGSRALLTWQP
mmetsp:Transcript_11119/g.29548  ORF Transcript_11119/g.29548 Transcript_11119/m.29548 type:complete len:284 (+) Transcript_11119:332-1183(+)